VPSKIINELKSPKFIPIALILFIILTIILYWVSIAGPYIYDDLLQIVLLKKLHQVDNFWDVIFCGSRENRITQNVTFALNWVMGDGSTVPFHITNLALHIINGFLVFNFLKRIFPKDLILCLFASGVFLIHPLQIQAVSYIMGRISLLEAFFYLLSLNVWQRKIRFRFPILYFLFILSLFTKEPMVLLPITLIAYEWIFNGIQLNRKTFGQFLPFFIIAIGHGIIVKLLFFTYKEGVVGFNLYPYLEYLWVQFHYFGKYLILIFAAAEQSFIHPYPSNVEEIWPLSILGIAFILFLITLLIKVRVSNKPICFLIFIFFLLMAPTNSFLQLINPFAEYRLYLPNLVLFTLLSHLIFNPPILIKRELKFLFSGGLLLIWSISNYHQQKLYNSEFLLFDYALQSYPKSAKLHINIGAAFYHIGKIEQAEKNYLKSWELMKNESIRSFKPLINLALLYVTEKKYREAEKTFKKMDINLFNPSPPLLYFQSYLNTLNHLKEYKKYNELLKVAQKFYPAVIF